MSAESYIDKCVEATASIDAELLSRFKVGEEIGRGNQSMMRTLGEISVSNTRVYAGLKIPVGTLKERGGMTNLRLQGELAAIELLQRHVPELEPKFPHFMTSLAIEGSDPIAVLTEDVSCGGKVAVWGRSQSFGPQSELASSIVDAFADVDDVDVDTETIDYSLAFMAGTDERLLDFTPAPVRHCSLSNEISDRLYDLIYEDRALTVDIDLESPLGLSLVEHI